MSLSLAPFLRYYHLFPKIYRDHVIQKHRKFQPRLQCIQSATWQTFDWSYTNSRHVERYCEDLCHDEERKGIEQEYWEQEPPPLCLEVAVPYVRLQVAKPWVLMRSQQNCSKQEERQYWIECTEYVWRSEKLVSGQRNGRSPRSSHFPSKVILNSVKITEQLLLSHMQARSFFGSYSKGSA